MAAPALNLRSALYVPGASERALERARDLAPDAVILDLEDSVAPEARPAARDRVCGLIRAGAFAGRQVVVRINAIGSSWHADDLAAAGSVRPSAVLVPKLQAATDVLHVERELERCGAAATAIWAMLETPLAVLRALEIAQASEALQVLVLGSNDLLADLRAADVPGRRPLETSLALCVLAARASGRTILDGVYNDVSDLSGFEAECRRARDLGFDGKTLIHPAQIEPCHRAFAPTEAELRHAQEVVEAFERAAQAGLGVTTLNGRLIEALHVEAARRLLGRDEAAPPST